MTDRCVYLDPFLFYYLSSFVSFHVYFKPKLCMDSSFPDACYVSISSQPSWSLSYERRVPENCSNIQKHLLDLITLPVLGEDHKLCSSLIEVNIWRSSLCNSLHFPIILLFLQSRILLSMGLKPYQYKILLCMKLIHKSLAIGIPVCCFIYFITSAE
jgi:hypothetical protein